MSLHIFETFAHECFHNANRFHAATEALGSTCLHDALSGCDEPHCHPVRCPRILATNVFVAWAKLEASIAGVQLSLIEFGKHEHKLSDVGRLHFAEATHAVTRLQLHLSLLEKRKELA